MKHLFKFAFIGLFLFTLPAFAQETLIQLVDPLDEPEFYCVDIPGFRQNIRLKAPMMTHTCKPAADDELFTIDKPGKGQLFMAAYNLCLQAGGTKPGSTVVLKACGGSELQKFKLEKNGALKLTGANLCLTMAPGKGEPTGGPSHVRRGLSLETCTTTPSSLAKWKYPGAMPK